MSCTCIIVGCNFPKSQVRPTARTVSTKTITIPPRRPPREKYRRNGLRTRLRMVGDARAHVGPKSVYRNRYAIRGVPLPGRPLDPPPDPRNRPITLAYVSRYLAAHIRKPGIMFQCGRHPCLLQYAVVTRSGFRSPVRCRRIVCVRDPCARRFVFSL